MAKLDTLQVIEIAEGAEIQLRVAGPAVRALAWLIDFLIKVAAVVVLAIVVMGFLGSFMVAIAGEGGGNVTYGLFLGLLFIVEWIYHIIFEAMPRGATPGKQAMGLRVVRVSGAPISLKQAVARNLLRFADMQPCLVFMVFDAIPYTIATYVFGLACCIMTKRFQRLGDLAAGTVVVYTERKTATTEEVERPEIVPQAPAVPLSREEQKAIVTFSDRLEDWSGPRTEELASHAAPLTGTNDPARGVYRILEFAKWIRSSGK